MIARIIEFSVRNKWLVILVWLGVAIWGLYAVLHTPVDAIPDLSENQVIVFADWMGRSPQDIEDQVTYPLSVQLQGLAGVKAVRASSEFNFSMINVIFDEKTDFYFARQRVLEMLHVLQQVGAESRFVVSIILRVVVGVGKAGIQEKDHDLGPFEIASVGHRDQRQSKTIVIWIPERRRTYDCVKIDRFFVDVTLKILVQHLEIVGMRKQFSRERTPPPEFH